MPTCTVLLRAVTIGGTGSARNWKTVVKLHAISAG